MSRRARQLRAVLVILLLVTAIMAIIVILTPKQEALSGPLLTAYKDSRIQKIYKEEPVYEFIKRVPATKDLGSFTITYYTAGVESTGKSPGDPAYGITKSGATVEENVTIAVDPKVIPLGSKVYIEGLGYRTAQDTGSKIKGNRIDVYVARLDQIPSVGKHSLNVLLVN